MKLRITILKCHSWYLCQISLQIMLLPILIIIIIIINNNNNNNESRGLKAFTEHTPLPKLPLSDPPTPNIGPCTRLSCLSSGF